MECLCAVPFYAITLDNRVYFPSKTDAFTWLALLEFANITPLQMQMLSQYGAKAVAKHRSKSAAAFSLRMEDNFAM